MFLFAAEALGTININFYLPVYYSWLYSCLCV